ncbi:hypothetical protein TRFO_13986 [Tritrichomonas foetus]|uniref:Uncharacterized protein n=1 Tax=Tritrichomonas foetus TaxID=1144522 RepID=A0A1J4KWK6_9EUKA|nr:hypothetical protein TRFO_13986 [Tritrichomonas foetus]|eukprot:OHT15627.1 hypothetical protein TRFO_13986 [Tritrichomonas foetus]
MVHKNPTSLRKLFSGLLFNQTTAKSKVAKKRCLGIRSSSLHSFRFDPQSRSAGPPYLPQFSHSTLKEDLRRWTESIQEPYAATSTSKPITRDC